LLYQITGTQPSKKKINTEVASYGPIRKSYSLYLYILSRPEHSVNTVTKEKS
jgi:hypothetical protein